MKFWLAVNFISRPSILCCRRWCHSCSLSSDLSRRPDSPLIHLFDLNGSDSSSGSSSPRWQEVCVALKHVGVRPQSFIERPSCIDCFLETLAVCAGGRSCSLAARPFISVIIPLNVHPLLLPLPAHWLQLYIYSSSFIPRFVVRSISTFFFKFHTWLPWCFCHYPGTSWSHMQWKLFIPLKLNESEEKLTSAFTKLLPWQNCIHDRSQ